MRGLFWRLFWFVIERKAVHVAKTRGERSGAGGWLFEQGLRIESYGQCTRVSVALERRQEFSIPWKIVFWVDGKQLKVWNYGSWVKEVGRLAHRTK